MHILYCGELAGLYLHSNRCERFTFALIRGGKFIHSQEVSYYNPALYETSREDTWLAKIMKEAYNRELSYAYLVPMRRICFATYIRVLHYSVNDK
jgi:hypothetical protein